MTIIDQYQAVRNHSVTICEPLKLEDYLLQPVDFVSPAKWHLAHTTWFFETLLLNAKLAGYKAFNDEYSFLFNSYYNSIGDRILRSNRGSISRPSVEVVMQYRQHVDHHMIELLNESTDSEVAALVEVGLHHEQQHQELMFTDIKYSFFQHPNFPAYKKGFSLVNDINDDHGSVLMDEGVYQIGHAGHGFGFDNEFARHKVYLNSYRISKSMVTNAEYLAFIEDGGYQNHEHWLDEGWTWINANKITAPLYWHQKNGLWFQFTLGGLEQLVPEAILAHVSHFEASAFASWCGKRLPTEAEWEVASEQFSWGKRWEHTNSAYLAYPGYEKPSGEVGEYNGKFMMNQMVLRGASVATPAGHARNTYRNFFPANTQWQFSGIRLAENG